MRELIPELQVNVPKKGYQSNILIDYVQSIFGNEDLQFKLTAQTKESYLIVIVHRGNLFLCAYDGKKVEMRVMAIRGLGRIDETFDGITYTFAINDKTNNPFYSGSTANIGLIKEYRRLVNVLLVEMR